MQYLFFQVQMLSAGIYIPVLSLRAVNCDYGPHTACQRQGTGFIKAITGNVQMMIVDVLDSVE